MSRLLQRSILSSAAVLLALGVYHAFGELNKERGNGPTGVNELNFTVHRIGTDHAEGITSIDMNGTDAWTW